MDPQGRARVVFTMTSRVGRRAVTVVGVTVGATMAWIFGRPLLDRPLEAPEAAARIESATAAGDSVVLGRLARRQCQDRLGEDRQKCYEDYFLALSGNGGVRLSLASLSVLADVDRNVQADGHVYTHMIGIRAWQPGLDVGKVFASCTGLFQSGCYHGVIQSYLTGDGGLDSTKVSWLCDTVARDAPGYLARFQCAHGLGHGLEMALNWDLPRALDGCNWLTSTWDREACYGGVFMENAAASSPRGHHAPADALALTTELADAEDHSGHDMPSGRPVFQMRDSTDALYPCSIMADQYLQSCYQLQGGILLDRTGYDWEAAATECDQAPDYVRHLCYLSLGTNASGFTVQDTKVAIRYCSLGDPGYQPWCFLGVAKNYIDVTGRPEDGIGFCKEVPAGRNQRQCWVAIGEELMVLHTDDRVVREAICRSVPENGRDGCRYGAGLLAAAPEGFPIQPGTP